MRKFMVYLVMAALLLCSLSVPALAEEKAEGWNNVNAEGYVI